MDYQKKAFEVEISNGGPRGYETAITLKLPATWAEFHDALQKARIPDGRNCGIELTRSWWAGLSSELIGGAQNLYELNLFAMRLTMLTSVELLSMDGLLKMEQARGTKSIPIPRLMPEPIQQAARRIDGKAYNDRCFGICVVHDLATNEYAVVTESGTSPEVDRNIFYVDNDGDKHWFQADLPDTLVKEMFSCCEDVHAGKLLPQGYQALSSVLFDNETGFVSGENQAAKSPFSTWQLRIDHGHPEYYTPHYHTDRESAEQDLNGRVAEYKRYHTIREKNGEFAYLYPYSKAEAGRRGELDRWEESFRANVSCAREIEAAIRGYSSGDGILQPGTARNILEQWGFKRTNFVLANTLQQLGPIKDRLSEANRNWQRGAYIPQDGTNRYFAVDTALICMDQFISQVRDAYKQLELLGPEHCESGSYEKLDYEGRVLVLAPDTLKESYWNQRSQLWLAHDGFGCTPGAIGRSIRCTCLGDGEETRWNRTDFIGVLKEECLPQWAAEALSKLTEGKEQSHTQGGMTMQ